MSFGNLAVTLRPIRFATLVDPLNRDAVSEAIRINTFLWGGTYNPVIPIFSETPANWGYLPLPAPQPKDILEGYLRSFDPDVLIACGKVDLSSINTQGRTAISAAEVTTPIADSGVPGYGIGLFEVLAEIAKQEFKYVRRDTLKLLVPTLGFPGEPILSAIFGDLPAEAKQDLYEELLGHVDSHRPVVGIDNFLELWTGHYLSRHRVCGFGLTVRGINQRCVIFLFDHTCLIDVIDYWNLRALGWHVLPIPRAVSESDIAKSTARKVIADFEPRDESSPRPDQRVTIMKSRSISESEHLAFVESLRERPGQIMLCQVWYPPIWDEFAHERGHVSCGRLVAETSETPIGNGTETLQFAALAPRFMAKIYRGGCSYANDVTIRRYGHTEFATEVIPPHEPSVAHLLGLGLSDEWRIGSHGLTFLGRHAQWTIPLQQPDPRSVVATVLHTRGWAEFNISPAGNVAYQMMRHLGGPYGIDLIKNRRLIEYLEDLSRSGRDDLGQTFRREMAKIGKEEAYGFDTGERVRRYTDAHIFTLGLRVQCSVCTQRSWYALDVLSYEVRCPRCLSQFALPIHDPGGELKWAYKNVGPFASLPEDDSTNGNADEAAEVAWAYRSAGPFAAPKRGGGAYSVLLTVNFLRAWSQAETTTVLSFEAKGKSGEALEADFMMF